MQVFRHSFSLQLSETFALSQGIWLSKEVRHQLIMVRNDFRLGVHRSLRLGETNELGCNCATLMHELVKAMLAIGAWLSQNDWPCMHSFIKTQTRL